MRNLENRLAKLETLQQAPRQAYTDAARAVKAAWLLDTNGPGADRIRELLASVPEIGEGYHGNA